MTSAVWSKAVSGLNIHRINDRDPIFSRKNPEAIISIIVKTYVERHSKQIASESLRYKEIENISWDPINYHQFSVKFYQFTKWDLSPFGSLLAEVSGDKDSFLETTFFFVVFLYRSLPSSPPLLPKVDIYAITTRDGWAVAKPFTDYDFPIKIALRVIEKKFSIVDSKMLVGDKEGSTEYYRSEYRIDSQELDTLWRYFKVFTGTFKQNSSFYQLPTFKNTETTRAYIGLGKIQILRKIPFNQYPAILNLFSKIHYGEKTIHAEGEKEEIDDPVMQYLKNISIVDELTSSRLDSVIIDRVAEHVKDTSSHLTLSISHRYYRDFHTSNLFSLSYGGYGAIYHTPPTFEDIVLHWRVYANSRPELGEINNIDSLIKQTKLSYSKKPNHPYPIIQFLVGQLVDKESGRVFFRNDGMWLQVAANHIISVQSAFYQLLKGENAILIQKGEGGQLTKPWIAQEKWASYCPEDFDGKTWSKIEKVMRSLDGLENSFISETGQVKTKYLTYAIFDGLKDTKLIKKIDKCWAELSSILKNRKQIAIADLLPVFKDQAQAKKVYEQLIKPRKLFKQVASGQGTKIPTIRLISDKMEVLESDLSNIKISLKLLEKHKSTVETYLKNHKSFNEEDFTKELSRNCSGIGQATAEKIANFLKGDVKINVTFKNRYVPLFYKDRWGIESIVKQSPDRLEVNKILKKYHDYYRLVCKEEGYNRQYFGVQDYLVFDQVYASEKEKVELFDLLYHDDQGKKLYLYHVKKQFGEPTRQACAQIRISVQVLQKDQTDEYQHLKKIYSQGTSGTSQSLFKQKVKQQLENLGEEGFLSLFKENKIIFVYAFIDMGAKERKLQNIQDPRHSFQQDKTLLPNDILEILKKKGIIDSNGKLSPKAFYMTDKDWREQLDLSCDSHKKAYDYIRRFLPQYQSLGAKLELLHLRDYIRTNTSFELKILQIDRQGNTSDETDLTESIEFSTQKDTSFACGNSLTYAGDSFELEMFPSLPNEIAWFMMGYSDQYPPAIKMHALQLSLQNLNSEGTRLFASEQLRPLKISPETESLRMEDLKLVAPLSGKNLIVFESNADENLAEVIDEDDPIINYNSRAAFKVCLVRTSDGSLRMTKALSQQEQAVPNKFITTFDQWKSEKLKIQFAGIQNNGTDCFLNSILQLILHTNLFNLFADPQNLNIDPTQPPCETIHNYLQALRQFFIEYAISSKSHRPCTAPSKLRKAISRLSSSNPESLIFGHQDAKEPLERMLHLYNSDSYTLKAVHEISIHPNTSDKIKETSLEQVKGAKHTVFEASNTCESSESECDDALPIDGFAKFSEAWKAFLQTQHPTENYKYVKKNGEQYTLFEDPQATRHIKRLVPPENGFFIRYKRWNDAYAKIKTKLEMDSETLQIQDQKFVLSSFVIHKGSNLTGGHYIAYCKGAGNEWKCCDDESAKTATHEQAMKAAKDAYILFFEKDNKSNTSREIIFTPVQDLATIFD